MSRGFDINGRGVRVKGRGVEVGSAIPDSVIDNFEPPLYEQQGNTLSNYYSGDLSGWQRQQSTVYEGNYALQAPATTQVFIADDGGDFAVAQGDTFACETYPTSSNTDYRPIAFGVQDETGFNSRTCYEIKLDNGFPAFEIHYRENGSLRQVVAGDTSTAISANEFLTIRINWQSNGKITATLEDASDGSQITQVSGTNTSITSGGVGYGVGGKASDSIIDNVRFA